MKQVIRITWNGSGGELDSRTLRVNEDNDDAIRDALIELVRGQIVSVGDSFNIEEAA